MLKFIIHNLKYQACKSNEKKKGKNEKIRKRFEKCKEVWGSLQRKERLLCILHWMYLCHMSFQALPAFSVL